MTNHELIERFEQDLVSADSFHHADHVQLAFAYLSLHPPLQALEKFAGALKRFAVARGKAGLYHETVTHAYFFLIRERMAQAAGENWEEFARRNPDLLTWKNGILTQYYHDATLQSDFARAVFVFPDKRGYVSVPSLRDSLRRSEKTQRSRAGLMNVAASRLGSKRDRPYWPACRSVGRARDRTSRAMSCCRLFPSRV